MAFFAFFGVLNKKFLSASRTLYEQKKNERKTHNLVNKLTVKCTSMTVHFEPEDLNYETLLTLFLHFFTIESNIILTSKSHDSTFWIPVLTLLAT